MKTWFIYIFPSFLKALLCHVNEVKQLFKSLTWKAIGFTYLRRNCLDITVLKNFEIFTGKLQACNFIKNRMDSCSIKIWELIFLRKNWFMWNKKFLYDLGYLKLLRQCPKTLHGSTYLNKIKKLSWTQLPISKSLLP